MYSLLMQLYQGPKKLCIGKSYKPKYNVETPLVHFWITRNNYVIHAREAQDVFFCTMRSVFSFVLKRVQICVAHVWSEHTYFHVNEY